MTFQIRHDGRVFTVHTTVGDDQVTRVEFDEEPAPARAEAPSTDGVEAVPAAA